MPMFHPHAELVYVVDGSIPITVDGHSHTLSSGELAVIFPYVCHSYENAPDSQVVIILFDAMSTLFDNTLLTQKPTHFHTDGRSFYPLIDRAVTMYGQGKVKTAMAYLNALLGEILEVLPLAPSGGIAQDVTTQLLSYCSDHFAEDITVKSIANALYISQSYVSKLFSQKLGYSFPEYINTLRIHKAQTLLRDTDLQIVQIMAQCGFQNQSSFNRVFRKQCGVSPKQYRNESRK